jgi:photosystem II stability/assembly factor-like uncharacterized protein
MKRLPTVLALSILHFGILNSLNAQWISTQGPFNGQIYSLTSAAAKNTGDTVIYAGSSLGYTFTSKYRSQRWEEIDGGKVWTMIKKDSGFTYQPITQLATLPNPEGGICVFALNGKGILYRSMKSDINWERLTILPAHSRIVRSILVDSMKLYAATDSGLYFSEDYGDTWMGFENDLSAENLILVYGFPPASGGKRAFLASSATNIYLSLDRGQTWSSQGTNRDYYTSFTFGRNIKKVPTLYAVHYGSIVSSNDSAKTWTELAPFNPYSNYSPSCVYANDTILYAGSFFESVFFTLNGGSKWVLGSYPTDNRPIEIHALIIVGEDLYSGGSSSPTDIKSVWRRPLLSMLTGVAEEKKLTHPSGFRLEQNYPNPFNPSTTISFSLPERAHVSLTVFDVMGRTVATLAGEELSEGSYSRQWNASGSASGVYFYRLQAGAYMTTKRLVVLR